MCATSIVKQILGRIVMCLMVDEVGSMCKRIPGTGSIRFQAIEKSSHKNPKPVTNSAKYK